MNRLRALLIVGGVLGLFVSPPEAATAQGGAAALELRLTQPVTADFRDVDFASAIQFLSESAGVNIILSEKAKALGRPVTVHLAQIPLNRALEYLLQGQGLLSRFDQQTIWVATRDEIEAEPMETRVFFLKQGPGLFASFEPIADTRKSAALQATAIHKMKTIKDILADAVPQVGKSAILLDERSGALVVTHVPYYLQQIEILLKQLDVTPAQVLIEARFIELTLTDTKEWGFNQRLLSDLPLTQSKGSTALQLSKVGTLLRGTQVNFPAFTTQTAGNATGLNLTILNNNQYQVVLHALAENKHSKTLSAPQVTTLNNETATMKAVTEYIYATRYQPTVVQSGIAPNIQTQFGNVPQDFVTKDLGILLHVTPSVGQDLHTITLALKPEVSEKKTDDQFGSGVTLPRFTTRNLETSIVIENGQTVMLGGLMKDTTGKIVTKVPILGSLPLVGKLFRRESDSSERSNLLIFVTAQIVNPAGNQVAAGKLTPLVNRKERNE